MNPRHRARGASSAVVLCLLAPVTMAQMRPLTPEEIECGTMVGQNRPYPMDYRTDRRKLEGVELGHFQPQVEHLVKPMFRYFGADLNFTLYTYPNHHRALVTMVKLGEREKTDTPQGLGHSIDCFFRRAIRFVPDDVIVRMLYAQYLLKKTRREDALGQLETAESFAGKEPLTYFNLGLLYVELGQFDKAVSLAHRAEARGVDIGVLKVRLQQDGHWREPER